MKINFTPDRFHSVCEELVAFMQKEVAKNPELPLKDAESISAQFANELNDSAWKQTIANIVLGFSLLPADTISLLLAVGYKMGQDDAKAVGEIVELENLFKKETNG